MLLLISALEFIYNPSTVDGTAQFYTFWIFLYLIVHIIWDMRSDYTPDFFLGDLKNKVIEILNAVTFATSLYIVLMVVTGQYTSLGEGAMLPLLYSGVIGVLAAAAGLQPYDSDLVRAKKKQLADN